MRTEYVVIEGERQKDFESAVSQNLNQGFECIGGVSVTKLPDNCEETFWYSQAMQRYVSEPGDMDIICS